MISIEKEVSNQTRYLLRVTKERSFIEKNWDLIDIRIEIDSHNRMFMRGIPATESEVGSPVGSGRDLKQDILEAIRASGRLTKTEIRIRVKGDSTKKDQVLAELVAEGLLQMTPEGRAMYYQLTEQVAAAADEAG
jgi:hypothetical protein